MHIEYLIIFEMWFLNLNFREPSGFANLVETVFLAENNECVVMILFSIQLNNVFSTNGTNIFFNDLLKLFDNKTKCDFYFQNVSPSFKILTVKN